MSKKLESKFQAGLVKELKNTFKGCIVLKTDPTYIQGIPDILVLHKNKWAALECKRYVNARHRPNQDYYVNKMNEMSYSTFVYPENKEEVMTGLKKHFK